MAQDLIESILDELRNEDPRRYEAFLQCIVVTVDKSFDFDALMKNVPRVDRPGQEVRRRAGICAEIIREMRDLGSSWNRIMDEMPNGLRARLDGVKWTPEKEGMLWTPTRHGASNLVIPGR